MFHAPRASLSLLVGVGVLLASCSTMEITVQGQPDELAKFDGTLRKHVNGEHLSCSLRIRDQENQKDIIRPCEELTAERVESTHAYGATYRLSGSGSSTVGDVFKEVGLPFTTYFESYAVEDPIYIFVGCPPGCSLKCSWCTGITVCRNPATCKACQ
jgi:hypothetical protein